jgi:DNA-binding HxlR family transcriptional regulator
LSRQIGISTRTVQRILSELETGGFIRRKERYEEHRGRISNEFDLSGLVNKLKAIAPDVNAANEEAKNIKEKAVRRKRSSSLKPTKLQVVPKS